MSENLVRLKIDGKEVSVPAGTLVVDAAKQVGISIPVFCYHPKMEPVGMCRMCLVEIGRPVIDRETGKPRLDTNGQTEMRFGPKLETACTTPVGEGWEVLVNTSSQAVEGRSQVVEFLLTSHPLDCPVCDKGGECPLQNLTMEHGPGESRFAYSDKNHLAKHVPLGDLIFLDRERCIQCGRCVRFQEEIAGEPVIGFFHRGRQIEIVTGSEPGFDSVFSGNTTDICPVGALTTADFRFGARAWELGKQASICSHCAVGCNLTLNTRREAMAGGKVVIKRVMPRQNEEVNEIWLCDKGRFGHHYSGAVDRLRQPMVRRNGELVPSSWEEAFAAAAQGLKVASGIVGLAGGRASNEDLYCMQSLVTSLGGNVLQYTNVAGGNLVRSYGMQPGSNLGKLGAGDAILVLASDLYEEAPLWWLRIRQAAKRGAAVISANSRATKLDAFASHILRTSYENPLAAVSALLAQLGAATAQKSSVEGSAEAAAVLKAAENVVVFYGGEGLDLPGSALLAEGCARILDQLGAGKTNSGLVGVWPSANNQGAWDMGYNPALEGTAESLESAGAVLVMAADPVGDQPEMRSVLDKPFLIVQELFLTDTASMADVVFPVLSFAERDGTYTSGERRVQRFFPALMPSEGGRADWEVLAGLAEAAGISPGMKSTADVLQAICENVESYAGVTIQALAGVKDQYPDVGGEDLYYGGTSYTNEEGCGVQLPRVQAAGFAGSYSIPEADTQAGYRIIPVNRLYDLGRTLQASTLLEGLVFNGVRVNPSDLEALGLKEGEAVSFGSHEGSAVVVADPDVPKSVVLAPRSTGLPFWLPGRVDLKRIG